jgi:hypothetical protein
MILLRCPILHQTTATTEDSRGKRTQNFVLGLSARYQVTLNQWQSMPHKSLIPRAQTRHGFSIEATVHRTVKVAQKSYVFDKVGRREHSLTMAWPKSSGERPGGAPPPGAPNPSRARAAAASRDPSSRRREQAGGRRSTGSLPRRRRRRQEHQTLAKHELQPRVETRAAVGGRRPEGGGAPLPGARNPSVSGSCESRLATRLPSVREIHERHRRRRKWGIPWSFWVGVFLFSFFNRLILLF